jgi:hypothetical protein
LTLHLKRFGGCWGGLQFHDSVSLPPAVGIDYIAG